MLLFAIGKQKKFLHFLRLRFIIVIKNFLFNISDDLALLQNRPLPSLNKHKIIPHTQQHQQEQQPQQQAQQLPHHQQQQQAQQQKPTSSIGKAPQPQAPPKPSTTLKS